MIFIRQVGTADYCGAYSSGSSALVLNPAPIWYQQCLRVKGAMQRVNRQCGEWIENRCIPTPSGKVGRTLSSVPSHLKNQMMQKFHCEIKGN